MAQSNMVEDALHKIHTRLISLNKRYIKMHLKMVIEDAFLIFFSGDYTRI